MADNRAIWRVVFDALVSAPVALGLDLAFKNVMKASADKAIDLAKVRLEKQKEIACARREILEDLRIMGQKDPKSTENLWRRYEEAHKALQENRFIELLGEIEKDSTQGRRPMLEFLNEIDDTRFWLAMYMLEHDWFMEWFQRVRRNGGRIARKDIQELRNWFQSTFDSSKGVASKVARKTDDAAGQFANLVGKFADWLA